MNRAGSRRPALIRLSAAVAVAVLVLFGPTPAASAHVRVSATDATPGGYGLLTFRVPTESDTASTTQVIIKFPADTPITSVSVAPVPGWKATVHTARLDKPIKTDDGTVDDYVTRIDWKADYARTAIKPGQFGLFNITAGPLPRTSSVVFPTDQHYSDGTVVAWDQIATGNAEPDHPAPTLQLASAAPTPAATADPRSGATGGSAARLAVIGIAVATIAALIAIIALLRTRRPTD